MRSCFESLVELISPPIHRPTLLELQIQLFEHPEKLSEDERVRRRPRRKRRRVTHGDELSVPLSDVGSPPSVLIRVLVGSDGERVGSVVLAVLEDLNEREKEGKRAVVSSVSK